MHVRIANSWWLGNVPGIPGACATRNFMYLSRGPYRVYDVCSTHISERYSCNKNDCTPWPTGCKITSSDLQDCLVNYGYRWWCPGWSWLGGISYSFKSRVMFHAVIYGWVKWDKTKKQCLFKTICISGHVEQGQLMYWKFICKHVRDQRLLCNLPHCIMWPLDSLKLLFVTTVVVTVMRFTNS